MFASPAAPTFISQAILKIWQKHLQSPLHVSKKVEKRLGVASIAQGGKIPDDPRKRAATITAPPTIADGEMPVEILFGEIMFSKSNFSW
mmetsp:Transcript_10402/g.21853  ORF Transcript_10402/g.21853 Transcript_10402/m.21853 type:complete len:89 (+) Transcript_10402:183-449(+)